MQVVWSSQAGHKVRIPVSVLFRDYTAPSYIQPKQRQAAFNYTYKLSADTATVAIKSRGITAAAVTAVRVNISAIGVVSFVVPKGNSLFAVGIFDEDVPTVMNLDLSLFQGNTQLGMAASTRSTELLEFPQGLPAGSYTARVTSPNVPTVVRAYVHVWMLPDKLGITTGASMQASPSSLAFTGSGGSQSVHVSFKNLNFSGAPVPPR